MKISLIVAMGKNNQIGLNNKLLWSIPSDLRQFREFTSGRHILMGKKTFESIGRPLPKRVNMVLTRDTSYAPDGVEVFHTIDDALRKAREDGETELFIIGGGEIYRQTLGIANNIYLTRVDYDGEADTFFPEIGPEWLELPDTVRTHRKENEGDYNWEYVRMVRVKS